MSASLEQDLAQFVRRIRSASEAEVAVLIHQLESGKVAKSRGGKWPRFRAPEGGRIHTLELLVDEGREWNEAINAAGPNTPENYNARKVGDLYLPTSTGIKKKDFVLLNFGPKGGSWERALAWGCQYPQLKRSVPRDVFAVGKAKPELHRELGMDPMYLVATTECAFDGGQRACGVWWGGAVR